MNIRQMPDRGEFDSFSRLRTFEAPVHSPDLKWLFRTPKLPRRPKVDVSAKTLAEEAQSRRDRVRTAKEELSALRQELESVAAEDKALQAAVKAQRAAIQERSKASLKAL